MSMSDFKNYYTRNLLGITLGAILFLTIPFFSMVHPILGFVGSGLLGQEIIKMIGGDLNG